MPPEAAPASEVKLSPAQEAAARLYGDIPETKSFVNWQENAAAHNQVQLEAPEGWENSDSEEAAADRVQIANALADAGAGPSLIREVWSDITTTPSHPVTEAACMAELQRTWGSQTNAKIAAAQGVIAKIEASYPGAREWLAATGRGNDPVLIKKAAALASRRR